jgi:hypothetical protein
MVFISPYASSYCGYKVFVLNSVKKSVCKDFLLRK